MMMPKTRQTVVALPSQGYEILPEPDHDHAHDPIPQSIPDRAKRLIWKYDLLLGEIYSVRKRLQHMADVLKNPTVVRYREDAPPGYGLTYDMSQARIPDMARLGELVHEWQVNRRDMIDLLLDEATDEDTVRFLDKKLHPKAIACC